MSLILVKDFLAKARVRQEVPSRGAEVNACCHEPGRKQGHPGRPSARAQLMRVGALRTVGHVPEISNTLPRQSSGMGGG
jgi:hypothetical protein